MALIMTDINLTVALNIVITDLFTFIIMHVHCQVSDHYSIIIVTERNQ